mgnify:CR=1 FL=1
MSTPTNDSTMFKTGDIVVGSTDPGRSVYSATGARIVKDGVAIYGNSSDLDSLQNELLASIARNGGKKLGATMDNKIKKKGLIKNNNKNTVMQTSYDGLVEPFVEKEIKQFTVQFENDFGKIKARVEQLIEHPQAYMLVFSNEDAVVFEPKVGETLVFHTINREQVSVYYPGVTFDSPDSSKKFMILFKVPEENQE